MGVELLSEEWLARRAALAADWPERPGATATVEWVVQRGKKDEVRFVERVVDGRLVSVTAGPGGEDEVDYTLRAPIEVFEQVLAGAVDLEVGFMRGEVKLAGDMGRFLSLVPLSRSDEQRAALAALHAETVRPQATDS